MAYITPDGAAVHLKVFSRDVETGKWDLGNDVPLEVPQGRDNFPFVHLSWSHLGNDLAVMDAAGRMLIFSCAMALDRMQYIKAELAHPEAEVDGVVGLHWLAIYPYEQKVRSNPTLLRLLADFVPEPHCLVSRKRRREVEVEHTFARLPRSTPSDY